MNLVARVGCVAPWWRMPPCNKRSAQTSSWRNQAKVPTHAAAW